MSEMSNAETVREGINTDATMREDFAEGRTVREHEDVTVREAAADKTQREQVSAQKSQPVGRLLSFRQFRIAKQIPSGGEADIYRTETNEIIKLYRFGINPKRDVIENILRLSQQHPAHLVNMREFGFDDASQRWYVVMEYVPCGSLKEYFAAGKISTDVAFKILKELSEAVHVLHENNIIHQDIKPANVLIRTRNPLDLVLSDFGISSAVDVEASKHLTGRGKGTALYNTPEAFSGIVGKFTDWWGVGMMLLEGLAGAHPFDGLEAHVITFRLTTNDIEIPQSIPDEWQLLLKGLLTRNPDSRWGYEQVSRWLAGDRDIPIAVTTAAEVEKDEGIEKPYKFNDEKYYSLSKLAAAFVKDEASWNRAVEHMGRGMVSKWLENNEMNDEAIDVENQLAKAGKDVDVAVSCFVADHTEGHPFTFKSCLITPNNIIAFTAKYFTHTGTSLEQVIGKFVCTGELYDYYKTFISVTHYDDKNLSTIFELLSDKKNEREKWEVLEIIWNRARYLWPESINPNDKNGVYLCSNVLKNMICKPIHINCINELVQKNVCSTDIYQIKREDYVETLTNIIDKCAKCKTDKENVYQSLVKHKAPICAFQLAYELGNTKLDYANKLGRTGLMYAVKLGNEEHYNFFVNKGCNLYCKDKGGETIMHIAASSSNIRFIETFVKAGLDLNITDNKGRTPLYIALENRRDDFADKLINLGANADCRDNIGRTLLWHALDNGRQDIADKLIELGANYNKIDSLGNSVIHFATERRTIDTIKKYAKIVDVNSPNNKGYAPLDVAIDGMSFSEDSQCIVVGELLSCLFDNGALITETTLSAIISTQINPYWINYLLSKPIDNRANLVDYALAQIQARHINYSIIECLYKNIDENTLIKIHAHISTDAAREIIKQNLTSIRTVNDSILNLVSDDIGKIVDKDILFNCIRLSKIELFNDFLRFTKEIKIEDKDIISLAGIFNSKTETIKGNPYLLALKNKIMSVDDDLLFNAIDSTYHSDIRVNIILELGGNPNAKRSGTTVLQYVQKRALKSLTPINWGNTLLPNTRQPTNSIIINLLLEYGANNTITRNAMHVCNIILQLILDGAFWGIILFVCPIIIGSVLIIYDIIISITSISILLAYIVIVVIAIVLYRMAYR